MPLLVVFQAIILFFANVQAEKIDNKVLDQFKSYLHEIKSIAVDFSQTDSKNVETQGKLLISKPYKFRCNYYPPFPLVIIGNKNYVSVYDYDMQQVSRIKAKENIFSFLLVDDAELEKHFKFEKVVDEKRLFKITLYHQLSERHSTIAFNKDTKQIESMKIIESDNVITIKFGKIEKVANFTDGLFDLKNPDIFGPPERLDKTNIEKKYKSFY